MNQLSKYIGYRVLRKRFKKVYRDKAVQNFETASSAVIIFDSLLPGSSEAVKQFTKFLKKYDITTSVIGYVSQKDVRQEVLLWPDINFLTKKEVTWYGAPKGEIAEAYFSKTPDLLFVINFKEDLTIEYLTRLSRARFKVGCFTENENDLDLMINPGNKACEVGYFIEQVEHYVGLLNPAK
jgi:hypothetical protein